MKSRNMDTWNSICFLVEFHFAYQEAKSRRTIIEKHNNNNNNPKILIYDFFLMYDFMGL
jgi:hypothetical protein